jgi:hypothetical protein
MKLITMLLLLCSLIACQRLLEGQDISTNQQTQKIRPHYIIR